MSSTESGTYRIILDDDGYFDLFNLDHGHPLGVTADPDDYDGDLSEGVASLTSGNKLRATLEQTDRTREDSLFENAVWRFTDLELLDATRTHHAFEEAPIVSSAERLLNRLAKSETAGLVKSDITDDGDLIGRIVVFDREYENPAEPLFEGQLTDLEAEADGPFEVYQTATNDARYFVHYYIVDHTSRLARALRARLDDA